MWQNIISFVFYFLHELFSSVICWKGVKVQLKNQPGCFTSNILLLVSHPVSSFLFWCLANPDLHRKFHFGGNRSLEMATLFLGLKTETSCLDDCFLISFWILWRKKKNPSRLFLLNWEFHAYCQAIHLFVFNFRHEKIISSFVPIYEA